MSPGSENVVTCHGAFYKRRAKNTANLSGCIWLWTKPVVPMDVLSTGVSCNWLRLLRVCQRCFRGLLRRVRNCQRAFRILMNGFSETTMVPLTGY
jgi:hypothetical protein